MVPLLVRALKGEKTDQIPFWFMRQAGRYLPEYRELRSKAGSFLSLCYNSDLAAEVTLQPVNRFDMDAAILFSDILVIPDAMGMNVEFRQGEGPHLSPVRDYQSVERLTTQINEHLSPVAETVRLVRHKLAKEKTLIGFCGAPWTVACYMVEGKGSKQWEEPRNLAVREPKTFSLLIDKIIDASVQYLAMQVEAGAGVVQIFDSWAGVLSPYEYEQWVIRPTRQLIDRLRHLHPGIPVIAFPRGSGVLYERFVKDIAPDAVGIDTQTPIAWAKAHLPTTLQGNLDPLFLAADKKLAVEETKRILETCRDIPFIFNLGHGVIPSTPLENVQAVCDTIRAQQ